MRTEDSRGALRVTDLAKAQRWIAAPVVVSLAVMVFWGATPVLTRIATDDLDPLWVAVLRTVLAGIVALPLVAATERRPPSSRHARILLGVSAAAGFVVFPVVFTVGQERTSAMHGVGILAALPVFTGLYGMLVARRRPGTWWLAGCALALAGEAVIVAVRAGGGGVASLAGDLLVLASALVVSAGYVAGALLVPRGFSSAATTYWGVVLGALALLPLALVLLVVEGRPSAGAASWAAVLFLAVVTSIAGYVGWYWALARGGIARIAPLQFLQPLSGLVLAALVLGERLTWPLAVGAAAVIGGVTIARRE
jgi:drug/metabolite transporter (DMT)-like permease